MTARRRGTPRGKGQPPPPKTCGDFGGRTAADQPCPRRAGWGVKGRKTGPCRDHGPAADARLQASKAAFLEIYGTGLVSMRDAAREAAGVDPATIWRWRQEDAEFDQAVWTLQDAVDELRGMMVEDAAFTQIVAGQASASLVLAWLVNRRGTRWRRKDPPGGTGQGSVREDGVPRIPVETLRHIMREDGE